jgi:hypothetical protein
MHVNIPANSNSKEKVSMWSTSGLGYYSLTTMLQVIHIPLYTVSDTQKSKVLMKYFDL